MGYILLVLFTWGPYMASNQAVRFSDKHSCEKAALIYKTKYQAVDTHMYRAAPVVTCIPESKGSR